MKARILRDKYNRYYIEKKKWFGWVPILNVYYNIKYFESVYDAEEYIIVGNRQPEILRYIDTKEYE